MIDKNELDSLGLFHHDIEIYKNVFISDINNQSPKGIKSNDCINFLKHYYKENFANITMLDVACNAGGLIFSCRRKGGLSYALGFDARKEFIDQANFVKNNIDISTEGISFEVQTLKYLEKIEDKSFDTVYLGGILYHVTNPVSLLEQAGRISKDVVIVNTSYREINSVYHGFIMNKEPKKHQDKDFSLLGYNEEICWHVTSESVICDILKQLGFNYSKLLFKKDPESFTADKDETIGRLGIAASKRKQT